MPQVVIDCFPSSVKRYRDNHVIVAVDVIRATTLVVTAVEIGHSCFIARDLDHAFALREQLRNPVLAGELKGDVPEGFDMNNSPSDIAALSEPDRPIVTLSTSGTELMLEAAKSRHGGFVACFRNYEAVANHVAGLGKNVAVIGAGSRNEFREEDQMCCSWIAGILLQHGFKAANSSTGELVDRWSDAPAVQCKESNSVRYLERSGQMRDFDFVVSHVNDLQSVVCVAGNEVSVLGTARRPSKAEVAEAA